MVDTSAPCRRRDAGRGLAGLVAAWFLAFGPLAMHAALAQEPKPATEPAEAPAAGSEEAQEAEETQKEAVEEEQEKAVLEDSIHVDPRAARAMENSFEELYRRYTVGMNGAAMARMARGDIRTDATAIDRHVKAAARELTDHANIGAVLSSGDTSDSRRAKVIEDAGLSLIEPLRTPIASRNPGFMRDYTGKLLEVAPEMLKNHLYARIQIMLALSRLGDPAALNLLIATLSDAEQPVMIRQMAAQGITAIASAPNRNLSVNDTVRAAEALVAFLQDPNETFWPARARTLEALGHLRQISTIMRRDDALMSQAALKILADPSYRPEVRAWAVWALGWIEVPSSFPQVNYTLIAYHTGKLAASLGENILQSEPERAKYYTAILAYQLFQGLNGTPDVLGSGLINSRTLGPHRTYVTRVHQLVKQLASEAVNLTRAVGTLREPARQSFASRLAELQTYLEKNPPENNLLVPGAEPIAVESSTPSGNPGAQ